MINDFTDGLGGVFIFWFLILISPDCGSVTFSSSVFEYPEECETIIFSMPVLNGVIFPSLSISTMEFTALYSNDLSSNVVVAITLVFSDREIVLFSRLISKVARFKVLLGNLWERKSK